MCPKPFWTGFPCSCDRTEVLSKISKFYPMERLAGHCASFYSDSFFSRQNFSEKLKVWRLGSQEIHDFSHGRWTQKCCTAQPLSVEEDRANSSMRNTIGKWFIQEFLQAPSVSSSAYSFAWWRWSQTKGNIVIHQVPKQKEISEKLDEILHDIVIGTQIKDGDYVCSEDTGSLRPRPRKQLWGLF